MREGEKLKAFTVMVWSVAAVLAGLTQLGCSASMLHTFEEPRACMAPFVLSVSSDGEWLGSATALGEHTVYTAAHVVDELEVVWLHEIRCVDGELGYGRDYYATVDEVNTERDVARLMVESRIANFGELRSTAMIPDEPVYLYGVRTHGRSATVKDRDFGFQGWPLHGDSGGAVVDTNGRVTAIILGAVCGKGGCTGYTLGDGANPGGTFHDDFAGVQWVRP